MGIYHLIHKPRPTMFMILPILFDKPPHGLPRFQDVLIGTEDEIHILTRIGKKYHNQGMGEEIYMNHPNYKKMIDGHVVYQVLDDSYATYVFSVPEMYRKDYKLICESKFALISKDLKDKIISSIKLKVLKKVFYEILYPSSTN